ncbi:uncharacterized protein LOC119962310 [Scyliorhinus canicula]|uniref:uncharacterized protein LOC119962310 n=1 Tax=Scyliorhinus canicula TaxID=7830 RepID=UPI0018F73C9F|nr:uncharacterized protein LOC119962310 [Scyliorhinus canicula]
MQTPQIVVENSCEKQQSSQGKLKNSTEKDTKDINFSKSCGPYTENQTSTLKMNHQPYHRKARVSKSCPPSLRIEDTEQLLKEFYRESLSSIETDHWLDLMDSESNSTKCNSNPYLEYFNDIDTGANVKIHGAEYDLIQKIEKQKIQEDSRNKNWEDGNNQHEELSGIESQPQAYDSYNEGKDWQYIYTLGCGKFGEVTLVYHKNKKLTCAAKKNDSSRLDDDIQLLLSEYPDVFRGMGTLAYKYKILLKEDAKPVIHPPRRGHYGDLGGIWLVLWVELNMGKDGVFLTETKGQERRLEELPFKVVERALDTWASRFQRNIIDKKNWKSGEV